MTTRRLRRGARGFLPPRCPNSECTAHSTPSGVSYHRKGFYRRAVDGTEVQRFRCLVCRRKFSSQTFRLDYRLKRPERLLPVFHGCTSKTSLRRLSRDLRAHLDSVRALQVKLGKHCEEHHRYRMGQLAARGGLDGPFLMDELETFEQDRKLKPVTVPVLIEKDAWFLLHVAVAPMAPRGRRTPAEQRRLERIEEREGKRRSKSTRVVWETFDVLLRVARQEGRVRVVTDQKQTYATALQRRFGERLAHKTVNSREHRGTRNPLFPINHTLARLRDLCSRLVRRSWCASKKRRFLEHHLWIEVGFRNYVDGWRSQPQKEQEVTAAMRLGLTKRRPSAEAFLRWRDPLAACA